MAADLVGPRLSSPLVFRHIGRTDRGHGFLGRGGLDVPFSDLGAGRTALIVTHRFTTALRADCIHVMSQGNIIESGTHAELLALDGAYARAWRSQVEEKVISKNPPTQGRDE